MALESD